MLKGLKNNAASAVPSTDVFASTYSVTYVGLGDSRTKDSSSDIATSTPTSVYDDKYLSWLKAYSQGRMRSLHDGGVSGETSTQIVARVRTDVIAYGPSFCFLWMAANDAPNGLVVATSIANIKSAALQCWGAGIIPVLITESPHVTAPGGSTGQYADYYMQLNALIRTFAAQFNFPMADAWAVGVDPASTTGASLANYLEDTIHPAAIYCRAVGLACWNAISARVTAIADGNPHTTTIFDYTVNNANSRQVLANPLFGGSGGTAFGTGAVITAWVALTAYTAGQYRLNSGNVYICTTAGTSAAAGGPVHTQSVVPIVDGTAYWRYIGNGTAVIPATWFAGPTVGAATAAIWKEARSDNYGSNLCMACTGAAINDAVEINSGSYASLLTKGDTVYGEMFVSIQNAVNLMGVYISLLAATAGGSTMTNTFLQSSFGGVFYSQADFTDLGYVLQPIIVPTDGAAINNALIKIQAVFNGAGSCLIKVGRAQVLH